MLGRGVRIRGGRHLRIGRMVQVHDHAELHAWGSGGLSIGDYASIGAYSKLFVSYSINDPGKHIRIGKHVGIGDHAHLGGAGGLDIGDECIIGPFLSCHPENHRYENPDLPIRLQGVSRKGIRIGRNCWIGAKVTILDGVEIGDNCIIAAGAVVNRSLPAGSIAGGVPAKVIRSLYPEVHASALQA
ncbi:MAG: acyltransferase [Bacteroidetes bacterium]|nr:MAG: acyltransferase [Bacteroidota bacterium]